MTETKRRKGPAIVALGGGHGLSAILRGLKLYTDDLTAIVTVADDGGGSGVLREDLGMPPPGDIRSCMEALADTESLMQRLFWPSPAGCCPSPPPTCSWRPFLTTAPASGGSPRSSPPKRSRTAVSIMSGCCPSTPRRCPPPWRPSGVRRSSCWGRGACTPASSPTCWWTAFPRPLWKARP